MHLKCLTPAEAFVTAARACATYGETTRPRGHLTHELTNVTLVVDEPWQVPVDDVPGRNLSPFIGAVEALQLVGQVAEPDLVVAGSKAMGVYRDDGVFHGSYPVRIHGLVAGIVQQLERDPDSRRAVLTIHDSRTDLLRDVRDVPCTLALQYLVRQDRLCARTVMRSNDVWLGLPYDLTQFIALQGAIARALDKRMGWYSHSVGSLHLYDEHAQAVATLELPDQASQAHRWLWTSRTIDGISRTARSILNGWPSEYLGTDFEVWCLDSVAPALDRINKITE